MEKGQKNTLIIRHASNADAANIAVLSGQLGYPATAEQMALRLDRLEKSENQVVFVAETPQAELVGWIHVSITPHLIADGGAEVEALVVAEGARQRGVGQALMEKAEQWARQKGCVLVYLRSNVIRHDAHAFYEHLGYEHTKSQRMYQKRL